MSISIDEGKEDPSALNSTTPSRVTNDVPQLLAQKPALHTMTVPFPRASDASLAEISEQMFVDKGGPSFVLLPTLLLVFGFDPIAIHTLFVNCVGQLKIDGLLARNFDTTEMERSLVSATAIKITHECHMFIVGSKSRMKVLFDQLKQSGTLLSGHLDVMISKLHDDLYCISLYGFEKCVISAYIMLIDSYETSFGMYGSEAHKILNARMRMELRAAEDIDADGASQESCDVSGEQGQEILLAQQNDPHSQVAECADGTEMMREGGMDAVDKYKPEKSMVFLIHGVPPLARMPIVVLFCPADLSHSGAITKVFDESATEYAKTTDLAFAIMDFYCVNNLIRDKLLVKNRSEENTNSMISIRCLSYAEDVVCIHGADFGNVEEFRLGMTDGTFPLIVSLPKDTYGH